MKRTCAKIIIAAMLALLLVAGCKNDDDEDDTPAVEYKVLAGRLILYSGDGANVIVPTGTASIGNNAFKGCARLENVFIPASVTYIAGGAFRGVEIGYIAYGDTVAHWEEVVAGSSGLAASLAGQSVFCTDGVWNAPTNPNPTTPETPKGTGTVAIEVEVPAGYTLEIEGEDKDKFEVKDNGDGTCTIVVKDEGELPEGKYDIKLVVEDEKTGEKIPIEEITIEVTAGETTGGFADEPDDKPFEITPEIIEDKKKDVVYVRGIGGCYASKYQDAKEGDDENSGTLLNPFATIQKAVDTVIARNDGSNPCTIYVDGTLTQSAAASANGMADFSALGKNLTLTIQSLSGTATLDANGKSRVIKAPASGALNLTLENLVITGGNTTGNGGGIYYQSTGGILTVKGCAITGNEANYGGGVYVYGGTFTMSGGTISNCTANSYGGGVYINSSGTFNMSGTAKIAGCKTTSTSSNSGGGGIYNVGTVTITGGTISGCTSATNGGGVYVSGGTFTMSDGEISECTATDKGGGVYINSSGTFNMSGTAKITGCKTTSTSGLGGGIYNEGTLAITGGSVSDCTSATSGGGVYVSSGTFTMSGGTIAGNTASDYGGGVFVYSGTFNLTDGTIGGTTSAEANTANYGGGVYVYGGTFTMSGGTISNCTASSYGGGVYINLSGTFNMSGTAKIAGCKTTSSRGGGVYVSGGNFTMGGGTITGNTASDYGGGVFVSGGTFTMGGGEISNCTASSFGGGVYVSGGTFTMSGGTISGNTASSKGGGVYVSSGTFTMGGSASIPAGDDGKNDVFLANGKTITVAGALTAATPVATITPSAYTEGTQVLGAGTGVTITQGICDKFAVTPQADGTKWKINLSGNTGVLKKDEVSTGGGGISVTVPGQGTYTFKIESGGSEVVNGSKLQYGTSIVLSEVRKNGVLLTASDGTEWTIEIKDTGNVLIASATGYQAAVTIMPTNVPPIGMDMQIYVKVALTNGIVIDQTIQVTGP